MCVCVCVQKVKPSADSDQEDAAMSDGAHAQSGSGEEYIPTHVSEKGGPCH